MENKEINVNLNKKEKLKKILKRKVEFFKESMAEGKKKIKEEDCWLIKIIHYIFSAMYIFQKRTVDECLFKDNKISIRILDILLFVLFILFTVVFSKIEYISIIGILYIFISVYINRLEMISSLRGYFSHGVKLVFVITFILIIILAKIDFLGMNNNVPINNIVFFSILLFCSLIVTGIVDGKVATLGNVILSGTTMIFLKLISNISLKEKIVIESLQITLAPEIVNFLFQIFLKVLSVFEVLFVFLAIFSAVKVYWTDKYNDGNDVLKLIKEKQEKI